MNPRPRLLLFAGPNGSGKSTYTTEETLAFYGIPPERYINADILAKQSAVDHPLIPAEERERAAFRAARTLRQQFREDGVSFAFETVFSHPSTLLDMSRCRASGFEVVVLFVTTSTPEINVARVAGRVQSGGHDVPDDRIRDRYRRTMGLFPRIVEDAAWGSVYDNSRSTALRIPFMNGRLAAVHTEIPTFLRTALTLPLEQRATERQTVSEQFPETILPQEDTEAYTGPVAFLSNHYLVQTTSNGTVVRHDHLLLTAAAEVGEVVTIAYREGMGTLTRN